MTNILGQNIEMIENGNAVLKVNVYSNENVETILLLHGGPGVPDDMIEVVDQLKEKYQVITFDQRGTVNSKCTNCAYTMEEYVSDIDAITNQLNIKSFHIFGHSWGGLYAQIYAQENPHRIMSLFLCSPSSGTNKIWKQTEKEVMRYSKNVTANGEWMKMGWYSLLGMMGSNNAYRKLFKQVIKNYHKNYSVEGVDNDVLERIYATPINKTRREIIKFPLLRSRPNAEFPIIITYGDNDIYGESKKEIHGRFPTAEFMMIKSCGHIPWKHNPTEFIKILGEFY